MQVVWPFVAAPASWEWETRSVRSKIDSRRNVVGLLRRSARGRCRWPRVGSYNDRLFAIEDLATGRPTRCAALRVARIFSGSHAQPAICPQEEPS